MQKGNTELSREMQPIVEIESAEGTREWGRWHFMATSGKRIEAYDEISDPGCYVPWLAVFSKDGTCLFRCRADKALIFYTEQYRG